MWINIKLDEHSIPIDSGRRWRRWTRFPEDKSLRILDQFFRSHNTSGFLDVTTLLDDTNPWLVLVHRVEYYLFRQRNIQAIINIHINKWKNVANPNIHVKERPWKGKYKGGHVAMGANHGGHDPHANMGRIKKKTENPYYNWEFSYLSSKTRLGIWVTTKSGVMGAGKI